MAKKKRSRASRRQRAQAANTRQTAPAPVRTDKTEKTDFGAEYRYVIRDLRRMGLLAAGMFVLMVVLALILQ
jgi:hypothetical protein